MEKQSDDKILVVTDAAVDPGTGMVERGAASTIAEGVFKAIPVDSLRANMQRFFDQLNQILTPGAGHVGDFEVSEVQVSAKILGDGQIGLLGSGLKVGLHGGLTLILKRIAHPEDPSGAIT